MSGHGDEPWSVSVVRSLASGGKAQAVRLRCGCPIVHRLFCSPRKFYLYDLYDLAHVAWWDPYHLHHLHDSSTCFLGWIRMCSSSSLQILAQLVTTAGEELL